MTPTLTPAREATSALPTNSSFAYLASKRAVDLIGASLGLLLLAPALLLVALLIKLEDGGPILFTQTRVGKGGKTFRFFKFRSMVTDAEAKRAALKAESGQLRFKLERDPRITRVGAWLRRTSMDELPQLLNVLRGDMTLVGPRPALPEETAEYDAAARIRLTVQQGLTCLWQVAGRSLLTFEQQMELDREYVRTRTLWLDLKLLVLTLPAVASGRGAY
ncbi:MAG: sugar transferase [Planctomycetes bacterium]|nr:sugar transferase [Planctomycetota bacterium]